jgi:hypothetical protein
MGGRIHPGVLMEKTQKHVWQWYYDYDYLGNKYKAIYFGPRLDWMNLFKRKEKKNEKSMDGRRNKTSKRIKKEI